MSKAEVGTELSGIYRLDQHIASGGMGEVYLGHNIHSGDRVAIKIVLPEFARDETILSLFRKEARILSHLSHDALVHYHVFTIDPGIGRPYLAMEFVDGDSLFDVLQPRRADAGRGARACAFRLASGLSPCTRPAPSTATCRPTTSSSPAARSSAPRSSTSASPARALSAARR